MPNILHNRHSIRLKDYDYSLPGAYFVTICSWQREFIFGSVFDGQITLNDCGRVVEKAWLDLPRHYPNITVDKYIVMPDHFHGTLFQIEIPQEEKAIRYGLSEIIRGFKSRSARQINNLLGSAGIPVWQRGFYDRIIRNPAELDLIRRYITENPTRWAADEKYPPNIR